MDDHEPDPESKQRQELGLSDASKPLFDADPQRRARQAIRSQATARDYAERQLQRAEQMIRDLGAKLQAVRREKGAALEAARTAHTALAQTERELRAVEASLISKKASSERAQREIQAARATAHDLRTKLTLANQTAEALRAQLDQERQARTAAEQERPFPHASAAVDEIGDSPSNQPAKRRPGRPPGKRSASAPHPAAGKFNADSQ
jgi:translation initiation factor IF-2